MGRALRVDEVDQELIKSQRGLTSIVRPLASDDTVLIDIAVVFS